MKPTDEKTEVVFQAAGMKIGTDKESASLVGPVGKSFPDFPTTALRRRPLKRDCLKRKISFGEFAYL